jgi:hypothetical protein
MAVSLTSPGTGAAAPSTNDEQAAAARAGRQRAVDQARIAAYLGAGDRMATLMGVVTKLCVGLIGLTLAAWALGALPVAAHLF